MVSIIEVCSEKQIADIALLARDIWPEHYVPIIGREQVDYMLETFQSEQAIAGHIAGGYEYYTVVDDEHSAGYVAVVPDMSEASLMISKIYVRKSARGHGLGKRMLEFVQNLCRQRRIDKVWLTVNRNNRHSIEWYSRMGFATTGPTVQDIGGGFVMDDFRMEKSMGQHNLARDGLKPRP